MQHLDEGTIHSWLDGALSADEAARAEAHVAQCAECATAVAEARGFIAASSRILTALDTVPRGVIPLAPRARTRNWPAWRAAAAVVVVALGSLVVLKRTGPGESQQDRAESVSPISAPLAATQPPADSPAGVPAGAAASAVQPSATASAPVNQASAPASAPRSTSRKIPAQARVSSSESAANRVAADNTVSPLRGAVAGLESRRMAAPQAQAPPPTTVVTTGSPTVLDAATESISLQELKRERVIGGTRITYAFEQKDTVTLLEHDSDMRLMGVAVTGAAGAITATGMSSGKAAAEVVAREAARGERPQGSPAPAAQKAAALPSASFSPDSSASRINTLSWRDSATGKTLTLSGRVPRTQLEEIKRRIERERTAPAKKP
jgi:anti-sigma factor RsiW